ncbi:sulfite exporter TauE/SafE family protein [Corynebacterium halotolerans]|uniref:sulfite exporter TauE/SafE family protein n=1 Tax=Corynebacterium halotolerans TaxID=225326 RepID=UPI003CED4C59
MLSLTAVVLVILIGSCLQRVSGLGLGLVAGPVLSVVMGPVEGILVVNLLAVLNAALLTWTVRAGIDWRKFALIGAMLIFGAVPGALLITVVSASLLQVIVGATLLVALAVVTFFAGHIPQLQGRGPALLAGVAGGFMNTLAGIAGPAMTVYAQASRWEQNSFSATLQPIFLVAGLLSVTVKLLTGAATFQHTDGWVWPLGVLGMVAGISLGGILTRRVAKHRARRLALILATAGAVVALVRGLGGLVTG